MKWGEHLVDRTISEIIRTIDSVQSKISCAESKLGVRVKLIDIKARNYFTEGLINAMIKYIAGYNACGKRQKMINKGIYSNKYSRCVEMKYWEHIITCKAIKNKNYTI